MTEAPLLAAGLLALVAAAVHGIAGELLVVRTLVRGELPRTRIGGPAMTKAMIQATWHIATVAFVVAGAGMLLAATALDGAAARAVAVASAAAFTGFALVAAGLGLARNPLRALFRHPGPLILAATAALAWWGAL